MGSYNFQRYSNDAAVGAEQGAPQKNQCCFNCGFLSTAVWLIIFNIVSFLIGMAIIGVCVYALLSDYRDDAEVLADDYDYDMNWILAVVYSMIVLAALIVACGTCGLFGSCCSSKSLFKFYILLIVLGLAALGVTLYYTINLHSESDTWVNYSLRPKLQKYFDDFEEAYKNNSGVNLPTKPPRGVDLSDVSDIQTTFDCCGVNGISDYLNSGLPVEWTEGCEENPDIGCVNRVDNYIDEGFWIAIYGIIVFGSLMLINIFLTVFLIYAMKKRKRVDEKFDMQRRESRNDDSGAVEITFPVDGSDLERPPPYNTAAYGGR